MLGGVAWADETVNIGGSNAVLLRPKAPLKNKPRDELLALQQATQVELKRYEDGLRIAMTVLAERGEQAG